MISPPHSSPLVTGRGGIVRRQWYFLFLFPWWRDILCAAGAEERKREKEGEIKEWDGEIHYHFMIHESNEPGMDEH